MHMNIAKLNVMHDNTKKNHLKNKNYTKMKQIYIIWGVFS